MFVLRKNSQTHLLRICVLLSCIALAFARLTAIASFLHLEELKDILYSRTNIYEENQYQYQSRSHMNINIQSSLSYEWQFE